MSTQGPLASGMTVFIAMQGSSCVGGGHGAVLFYPPGPGSVCVNVSREGWSIQREALAPGECTLRFDTEMQARPPASSGCCARRVRRVRVSEGAICSKEWRSLRRPIALVVVAATGPRAAAAVAQTLGAVGGSGCDALKFENASHYRCPFVVTSVRPRLTTSTA